MTETSGLAADIQRLQEVSTSGGDEQLRALGQKIKETFRTGLRHALVESTTDIYGLFGASITDPLDFSSGVDDGWGGYPYTSPAYYIQNMKRGEVLPAYLYEQQLRIYRDRSRKLCQENEYAICAIENRKNYAVGAEGFQYKIVSAKSERYEGMDKLLSRAQWVTDHWVEHNDMAEYSKDLMHRLDVDGEAFTRYFAQASGLVTIRTVEAEHVRAPNSEYGPHYSFGIQTDPEDVETREGYWVVEDPSRGWIPSFVPAEEICHIKLNTPRSAKRGLPTFYPCEQLLRIASDLLVGVAKNANHRAKIAMVRTVTGALADAATSMMQELADVKVMDPASGTAVNVEKFNWGTILTQPDNVKTEFPNANFDSGNFDVALQMILRAVAARLVMPEWMLTVNAQNSNFSSSLIAEAPSTKAFEDLQQMLLKRIGTNRMRSRESMLWYQIRHAVKTGLLPPETLQLVKIECQGPSLVVRDKTGEASQNKLYYDMRAKSKRIIQMENNWDPEQVRKDFEEDDAEQMKLQAMQAEQEMKIQQAQMQQQAEASLLGMAPDAGGGDGGQPGEAGPDAGGAPQQYAESGPNGGPGAGRLPAREGLEEATKLGSNDVLTSELKPNKRMGDGHFILDAHINGKKIGGLRIGIHKDHEDKTVARFGDTEMDPDFEGMGLLHHVYNEAVRHATELGAHKVESDTIRKPQVSKVYQNMGAKLEGSPKDSRYVLPLKKQLTQEAISTRQRKRDVDLAKHNEVKQGLHSGMDMSTANAVGGGTSHTLKVTLHNGMDAMYKPDYGERSVRDTIPEGEMHKREAAASDVADLVGMHHLVPPTITKRHPEDMDDGQGGNEGSLQLYKPGTTTGAKAWIDDVTSGKPVNIHGKNSDLAKAGTFDYLIGNSDRHKGNWLLDDKRNMSLIDHGHSFPAGNTGMMEHHVGSNMELHHEAAKRGLAIPKEFHDLEWEDLKGVMDKHGFDEKVQGLAKTRLERIKNSKHIHELPFSHHAGLDSEGLLPQDPDAKRNIEPGDTDKSFHSSDVMKPSSLEGYS